MELNTTDKACWHRLGRVSSCLISSNKTAPLINSNSRRTRQNPHKRCPCVSGSPRTWTWQGSKGNSELQMQCKFPFLQSWLLGMTRLSLIGPCFVCHVPPQCTYMQIVYVFNFFCNILGVLLSARTLKWRKKEKRKILCLTSLVISISWGGIDLSLSGLERSKCPCRCYIKSEPNRKKKKKERKKLEKPQANK